ncbi:CAP domain-containing protein [Oceanobacillus kimchii]|uniref:CAP domain-containing protein n=1 Tax=Oceanobacillus kimchii TaxID=746691 RepID=UPI00232CDA45|nr:CAP domain-containing protein [Oceanobacillus kimchii]
MFKKVGIVAALSASLIFGGAFAGQADASANEQPSIQTSYKFLYSVNGQWNELSQEQINSIKDKLSKLDWQNINLETIINKVKQEQPKADTPKKEEEKQSESNETPAQPAQPEQSEEQNTKEQNTEQQNTEEQNTEEQNTEEQNTEQQANDSEEQASEEQATAPSQQQEQNNNQDQQNQEQSEDVSQFEQEVVELTNQEREKQGLQPLELDTELSKVAKEKSQDMQSNNYFDHNSPNYGSPFDMMQSFGIDYNTAGENIAQGQRSPEEVVNAWMNSEGHRANILNGDYTHIGVGHIENGNYWTQMFIGK